MTDQHSIHDFRLNQNKAVTKPKGFEKFTNLDLFETVSILKDIY
jgi:hypothetical protein